MSTPLSADQVAVITGASSGIGRAAALALAEKGARLSLLARSAPALDEVAAQARARGAADVCGLACDVRKEEEVERAIESTLSRFGRIDILINSAGLSLNGEVDGYSLDDWRTVIDTNLTGTFLTCRAVLPAMKQGGGGEIINISSGAGHNGIKQMAAYCASKFGVIGFTESLGLEVRNQNIRVSVLLPGSVATDFSRVAKRESEREESRATGYSLFSEEVASVIVSMLEQPSQAWMSEVVLRPLNLEIRRSL
ncbi:MAG TPA: SDR family NAD(P)-dependent oxidoreductase [Blastocatellia bacterium]|nr:SDR family NAD(P)-dependent oxidoreductase [Blastocatellia bacterium]